MPSSPIPSRRRNPSGFTLIEVLVVISIIVVLAGILLVALGSATESARRAKTRASLNSFRAACDAFALDHNYYPGVIPSTALADGLRLTSTQNALLHLLGGYRVYNSGHGDGSPEQAAYEQYVTSADSEGRDAYPLELTDPVTNIDWHLVVVPSRMGEGPFIGNKPYSPYYAPKASELVQNHTGQADYASGRNTVPNLVDSWGTPVLYVRRERTVGPIVPPSSSDSGMFPIAGQQLYLGAERLGELGQSQVQGLGPGSRIAFTDSSSTDPTDEQIKWFTLLLSHPAFYDSAVPTYGTARSAYMVLSAGEDGVFMARQDGPVDGTGAFDPDYESATHEDLDSFDDIAVYGGG